MYPVVDVFFFAINQVGDNYIMFKIIEAKEKRSKLIELAESIQKTAEADGRLLSDEESTQIEGYLSEVQSISDSIQRAEKELKQVEALQKAKAQANANITGSIAEEKRRHHISAIPDWLDDPKAGYKQQTDFYSDVLRAGQKGVVSEKLRYLSAVGSDEQQGLSDPYGGFLVPMGFPTGLLEVAAELDPTMDRVTDVPMATPTVPFNARVDKDHTNSVSGGLTVTRRPETVEITASRQKYEQIILRATGNFGLVHVSEELLEDSAISVAALLGGSFQEEFRSAGLEEKIDGTGAGEPKGVLTSDAKITITRAGGGNDIDYDDIVNMRSRCWRYSQAIWLANHDTYPDLAKLASADNAHIWQPSAREDRPDVLLGRPIFFTEYAKTKGTSGDLILCNWSQYLNGKYKPMRNASSIHVRFVYHEKTFKFWERNDGRPWWTSALKPKNSSNTLSPIVVLS